MYPRVRVRRAKYVRRASVIVTVSVSLTVVLGFTALAIDVAYLHTALAEMRAAADAAAMAGTGALLTDERLKGSAQLAAVMAESRSASAAYVQANPVLGQGLNIDTNGGNAPGGDLVIGHLDDPTNRTAPLTFNDPFAFNTVQVSLRHDDSQNPTILLNFARIFGRSSSSLGVTATATAEDGVVGFEINDAGGTADVLPIALHVTPWHDLLTHGVTGSNDNYTYDPDTHQVYPGPDGLPELNLYPGAGTGQLPPGNFGTVDIGSPNNSTSDIARQILYGVNESDLAYFGGRLELGEDGTLLLNGDTGLSAGIKDELAAIIGEPRTIPIFNNVSGPGNNAQFTVINFAGIRIMYVKLTGPMKNKQVIIQPAVVVDESFVTSDSGSSYFLYRPVTLCR